MKKTIFFALLCGIGCILPRLSAVEAYTDNQWVVNKIMYAADNNKPIPEPTAFRLRMTDNALIAEIKLEGNHWKDFQKTPFKVRKNVWPMTESVEIFLDPGRSCSKYVQIAAGVNGDIFDNRYTKKPWAAKWTVKRKDFKGGVIFEFVIPFDNEFKKPVTGEVWGFNICRNVKHSSPYFSTFAKVGTYFNTPAKFAELRIGTPKSFLIASQRKNRKMLADVEKEIKQAGLTIHFAKQITKLKKDCDELGIQAVKDELRLLKAMKEIK